MTTTAVLEPDMMSEPLLELMEPYNPPVADAQSTKSPGTVESVEGIGSFSWSEAANAKASDNSYATVSITGAKRSHYLVAKGLGFSLPEGATPTGVVISVEGKASAVNVLFQEQLWLVMKGEPSGDYRIAFGPTWPTSDTTRTYGGAEDLWGVSALSATDVNHPEFGVAFTIFNTGGGPYTFSVDHITITVYYTEAPEEDRVCFATRSIELASNGVSRQALEDDVWGTVIPDGFLPTATPSGLEGRPTRYIIIPTQGDLGELPDTGTNKLSAVVKTRPGYFFAREAAE